jgi:hypothetical protein
MTQTEEIMITYFVLSAIIVFGVLVMFLNGKKWIDLIARTLCFLMAGWGMFILVTISNVRIGIGEPK